ncbi:MAG TPA: IS1595 family transposase [Candidatus Acidoferrales bacterium]|nr:IS1595 family transposase [Candidatus Acidoferrales bacterium]
MNLASLGALLATEDRARRFLVARCWANSGRRFCVRCGHGKVYRLAEKRYRCARCRYTFQDFSRRWIGRLKLSARKWLQLLKLFELEIAAPVIAREVKISYPTALKAAGLIRLAIAHESIGEGSGNAAAPGARGKKDKSGIAGEVFAISQTAGRVQVLPLRAVSPESVLRDQIRVVKTGAVGYTDRFYDCDALAFYVPRALYVRFRKRFSSGQVYVDRRHRFWSYAKRRFARQAVSARTFPLHLKELEFRYNHRHEQLFDRLVRAAVRLVPDH